MKAQTHSAITALALELYEKKDKESVFARDMQIDWYREALLKGTRNEDNITPRRALNWHFFPANDVLLHGDRDVLQLFTLRPTSLWIVEKRQKKLYDEINEGTSRSLYTTLGRVLHHIQDMSTPSHVVPVYHGATVSDPYEVYLLEHWGRIVQRLRDPNYPYALDGEAPTGDFVTLYQQGGSTLLANLDPHGGFFPVTANSAQELLDSQLFWKSYEEDPANTNIPFDVHGFGSFGPLGAHFGDLETLDLGDGLSVAVDRDVYLEIAAFFTMAAVRDTQTAFNYFAAIHTG